VYFVFTVQVIKFWLFINWNIATSSREKLASISLSLMFYVHFFSPWTLFVLVLVCKLHLVKGRKSEKVHVRKDCLHRVEWNRKSTCSWNVFFLADKIGKICATVQQCALLSKGVCDTVSGFYAHLINSTSIQSRPIVFWEKQCYNFMCFLSNDSG